MITVVGEAPGRTSDPSRPFAGGRCQTNLERLLGVGFHDRCRVLNLLRRWPGRTDRKGSRFPLAAAAAAAGRLELDGPTVLVGKRVARAFRLGSAGFFEATEVRGRPAMVVPHPSGVNLWWNDPKRVEVAACRVRMWLQMQLNSKQ